MQYCDELKAKDESIWDMVMQQQKLIRYLRELSKVIKDTSKGDREFEYRKKLSEKNWEEMGLVHFPLNINLVLKAPIPAECSIFSSAMAPFKLTFMLADGGKYSFIYKNGDDLRQDQLIL